MEGKVHADSAVDPTNSLGYHNGLPDIDGRVRPKLRDWVPVTRVPIPFREFKEFGQGLVNDSIKSAFMAMLYSSIVALITWKRRGIITSYTDAVIQALRALNDKVTEQDLKSAQLGNIKRTEDEW